MARRNPTDDPILASGVVRAKLVLARLALGWERLWPALWPALFVAGLFALAVLFDLLPQLPGWLHLAILLGFAAALGIAAWRGPARIAWPDRRAAGRRLEVGGGLPHRPLTAVADPLAAGGDEAAQGLWQVYRERRRAELRRLRIGLPRTGLARVDPLGLRAALVLLLIVGAVAGGGDGTRRLLRALSPDLSALAAGPAPTVEAWITPPAYTGQAPILLDARGGEGGAVSAPEGSTLLVQVHGNLRQPRLLIDSKSTPLDPVGPDTFRTSVELAGGSRLAVEQGGRTLARWALTIIPDRPPRVAFADAPAATDRGALRLSFGASDDYGLDAVQAVITRAGTGAAGEPLELDLPLPGLGVKTAKATSYQDLTPHPWAGTPVSIRLRARDARGQTGLSDPVDMVLPERSFHHPVARAIIEQRKKLTLAPDDRLPVVRALGAIAGLPDAYGGDVVVALGLRVAQRRLIGSREPENIADVQSLLWDLALRLEEGDVGEAERQLRAAQQALQEALARNAPDEELERLMNDLQQAIEQYLQALTEEMKKKLAEGQQPQMTFDPNAITVEREDLQRMLDQARELLRGGARDAARDMLSQLQEMLENLRAMPFGQTQGRMAEAQRMMGDLGKLAQRQQELMDRTFRQSQQGEQPGGPEASEQESLRQQLGELMRRFGEMTGDIPRPLGSAERAMREAEQALGQGDGDQAVDAQGRALEQLRQAGQAMAEALAQQFGREPGQGQPGQVFGRGRDPLGRMQPGYGGVDTSDVDIPEEADLQRAREILDELRKRAGERARPKPERDYIERLLKQF
ncbi:MAG: TIGR02302 family protein [Rhodospirillaceae bacterium]|nr:TIGR02302 family protein [Rhodospirillaceae bacterium]